MDALSESPTTARSARKNYRQIESGNARLRALAGVAAALAAGGACGNPLHDALRFALDLLSFDEGLVIGLDGHAPVVRYSLGGVLPEGARPVDNGVMRVISQDGGQPLVRDSSGSRLGIGRVDGVGTEVLVPLRFGGTNNGLLVLVSKRVVAAPSQDDLDALRVIGVMIGAALLVSSEVLSPAVVDDKLDFLTPRELQVFALLPRGLTNAAMAEELGIATGTVKTHVERILNKLGLEDRTQAAVRAADYGYGE
ncbi:response regulator protein [Burkholderia lata]|uniref:Response regulator protein n=1 Tax=Burkholderia lata (strain ATCC 17760 / DSM 23089 / LMG 22485 / NCIMB 9086 / R18194 / 383) TaxID=482957 RepID=A0A6P2UZM8_BURL3|nr:LuxR C-terminal-related transcriptional regulator [Burkholderia lata]VWC76172.1 response regulator protein [Burkholderia lata]